jgi:hypothetical protein
MCTSIYLEGEDVGNIGDLARILGGRDKIRFHRGYPKAMRDEGFWRCCLCPVNVERTAKANGYISTRDRHDSMMSHWRKPPTPASAPPPADGPP